MKREKGCDCGCGGEDDHQAENDSVVGAPGGVLEKPETDTPKLRYLSSQKSVDKRIVGTGVRNPAMLESPLTPWSI
jgi:hypothetical protein